MVLVWLMAISRLFFRTPLARPQQLKTPFHEVLEPVVWPHIPELIQQHACTDEP